MGKTLQTRQLYVDGVRDDTAQFNCCDDTAATLKGSACVVSDNTFVTGGNRPPRGQGHPGRRGAAGRPILLTRR